METLLSTLVQTTATVIALLLAAIAAYFVFLQGKSAEYDDRIEVDRAAIRTEIRGLQAKWPATMAMFLPPEFRDRFSARTGNPPGVRLIDDFARAVAFSSPELEGALSDVAKDDTFGGAHWRGRVYAVALTEAVSVISGGAELEQSVFTLGKPESQPNRLSAFPRSAAGAGFDEWRKDFDEMGTACRFLEQQAPTAISDFEAFLQSNPQLRPSPLASVYVNGVRAIFDSVNAVRVHLREIDDLSLSKSRYAFSQRVHGKSLLVLIVAAALVGVVVPLFSLTGSVGRLSGLAMTGILCATLALMVAALVQLGLDLLTPFRPDPKLYVSDRWLRPILEDLDHSASQVESGSPVELERIRGFLSSDVAGQVPVELRKVLIKYSSCAMAYNSSAAQLDAAALIHLRNDTELARFRRPYLDSTHVPHPVLNTSDLADPARVKQIPLDVPGIRETVLAVETKYPWGSRGRLSLIAAPSEGASLASALETVTGRVASSPNAQDFMERRADLLQILPGARQQLSLSIER